MAKARMLSKAISIDKELNDLSLKFQLIYTWCIPFLDDYGLLTNDPDKIKYMVFPRNKLIDEDDIKFFIDSAGPLLVRLSDSLYFKGFEKHNSITGYKRAKSEFKQNRYNKPNFDPSPDNPREPQETPSEYNRTKANRTKVKVSVGRFTPPTLEEVIAYCDERKNNLTPQHFLDHYTANGWMRGKNKIKDWQACVRTWEKNNQVPAVDVAREKRREQIREEHFKKYGVEPLS